MRREMAVVRCVRHPRYRGMRPKKGKAYCASCQLILILAHQHRKTADQMLGGLNPYQYLPEIERVCEDLEVVLR